MFLLVTLLQELSIHFSQSKLRIRKLYHNHILSYLHNHSLTKEFVVDRITDISIWSYVDTCVCTSCTRATRSSCSTREIKDLYEIIRKLMEESGWFIIFQLSSLSARVCMREEQMIHCTCHSNIHQATFFLHSSIIKVR